MTSILSICVHHVSRFKTQQFLYLAIDNDETASVGTDRLIHFPVFYR